MSYSITGTIKQIDETQTFASGFSKREFVVTENAEKYPQDIKLEAIKDKCGELDALTVGQQVTVDFNIRGNEHNGRHFVNLQAWKITAGEKAPEQPAGATAPEQDGFDENMPF